MTGDETLLEDLLAGNPRALARTISKIENRSPGYRDLVSELYRHAGEADVIGITGSPGAGKSTLVDKLAEAYRDRGETVGVIAIDPSSPFTGGAVLGDRIRMASNVGDMGVFVRSMSARGTLGGLATATADAVKAMDAFGKDKIIVETVGAGQNEIDVVRTADTVAVLVPPGSGDSVQTLKAGILEIADVFIVNKADREGADRTVQELLEMIELGSDTGFGGGAGHRGHGDATGHHGPDEIAGHEIAGHEDADETAGSGGTGTGAGAGASASHDHNQEHDHDHNHDEPTQADREWRPPVLETVATDGTGLEDVVEAFDDHQWYLDETGTRDEKARKRHAEEIRTLLREDVHGMLAAELDRRGGIDDLAAAVAEGETDPYTIADDVLAPLRQCLEEIDREGVESASR